MEVKSVKVLALTRMGKQTVVRHLTEHGAVIQGNYNTIPWKVLFNLWEEVVPNATI